ncbi:hypothetical protein [Heyndrickxia coagulans]|uniref:hypothetical protein n=1 Tax=Heyndrickxia coagulans TaxID=1398 RepID=UPI000376E713|nr:hypothetical protein [Heyndrickxia coagulans]
MQIQNLKRNITISALSLLLILAIVYILFNTIHTSGIESTNPAKKMVVLNENLVYKHSLYTPISANANADILGREYAHTDTKSQVFEIVGEKSSDFLCLIKDGEEKLYQSQKNQPLSLSIFKPTSIRIYDYDGSVSDRGTFVKDQKVIDQVLRELNTKNEVDSLPNSVQMIKQIQFSSSKYPGINILYQMEHDENGNCFITDSYSDTSWKINNELMEFIR